MTETIATFCGNDSRWTSPLCVALLTEVGCLVIDAGSLASPAAVMSRGFGIPTVEVLT